VTKFVSNLSLILYSSGSGVIGINAVIFGTWVLIFYNQVLGLNPILASLALGIALVVDAISDPLIGAWSDRFRSKWGRRHPFIYSSILPLCVSFYLLFTEPNSYSQSYLFWKLLIILLISYPYQHFSTLKQFLTIANYLLKILSFLIYNF